MSRTYKAIRAEIGRRTLFGAAAALMAALLPITSSAQEAEQSEELSVTPAHASTDTSVASIPVQALNAETVAAVALAETPLPELSPLEVQMLALVNGARASRGIEMLEWDSMIAGAARAHATDMMNRRVVSHTGSDGTSPTERMRRAGVKFRFGSENIWTYWGKTPELGPSTMHSAMMAEPYAPGLWNHIGNVLYAGYTRIGIGIVTAPSGVQYLSEKFADRA